MKVHLGKLLIMSLLLGAIARPAVAQKSASAPRSDGHTTPLDVYAPPSSTGCAPLAIVSHGAGG